ncbi:hypothetical protein B0J18DRAFT_1607 [Chaetomium sp. MPI-SDFR-AT-0129]|nr:hypothetical protein B0J18DRAFT_1607 [Chaetomium sp. MPI-SDFR-AT-0129]
MSGFKHGSSFRVVVDRMRPRTTTGVIVLTMPVSNCLCGRYFVDSGWDVHRRGSERRVEDDPPLSCPNLDPWYQESHSMGCSENPWSIRTFKTVPVECSVPTKSSNSTTHLSLISLESRIVSESCEACVSPRPSIARREARPVGPRRACAGVSVSETLESLRVPPNSRHQTIQRYSVCHTVFCHLLPIFNAGQGKSQHECLGGRRGFPEGQRGNHAAPPQPGRRRSNLDRAADAG